jgi:hypothetical protein
MRRDRQRRPLPPCARSERLETESPRARLGRVGVSWRKTRAVRSPSGAGVGDHLGDTLGVCPHDGVREFESPVGIQDFGRPPRVCGRRLSPTFGLVVRCRPVGGITSGSAQILVDESGRRRRVLRWSGRAVSVALLLWLGLLALGALGLQLLGPLPVLGQPQPRSSPPALPARIEPAAARNTPHSPGHRGAAASATRRGARPGRPDLSRGGERTTRPTRERRSPAAGPSKLSPPSPPGASGTPSQPPATTAPSTPPSAGTTSAPSRNTSAAAGATGTEHGSSTSSPGLTDSSPGQVKPGGAPASPPVPADPGQSAEHPPQGRAQSLTIPAP